jgi:hypothetical protein
MREALSVIADDMDSERLRKFLELGADREYLGLQRAALIQTIPHFSGRYHHPHSCRYSERS